MTEFLKSITMSAAGIIIFASVCEMILPDNGYKKYIHLAIGLMLILAFLSPIVSQNYRLELSVPALSVQTADGSVDDKTKKEVLRIYSQKLNGQISKSLSDAIEMKVSAECDIDDGEDRFGEITAVGVTVAMPFADDAERITETVKNKIYEAYGVDKGKISVRFCKSK